MREPPRSEGDAAVWHDLRAIRRRLWFPVCTITLAVGVALAIGFARSDSNQAGFRANVVVNALPPLFGPPVLPGPFDYARLATSDGVVERVASATGVPVEQLRTRMAVVPHFNDANIDFRVSGADALAIARAWRDAMSSSVVDQAPVIERQLTGSYVAQLDEAQTRLRDRWAAARAAPDDPVLQQQLKAAEENYATASRLAQSYDVVAATMRASFFTVTGPHVESGGLGSARARVGAALAIGLLAGVLGALALDYAPRRRQPLAGAPAGAPASIADRERRGSR